MTQTQTDKTVTVPGIFADNEWRPAHSTGVLHIVNPMTEQPAGSAPDGDAADVDVAVRAAARAFPGWSSKTAAERGVFLTRFAAELEARAEELSLVLTSENGSAVFETLGQAKGSPGTYRYFAGNLAADLDEPDVRPYGPRGITTTVTKKAIGVAGLITPWNYPLSILTMKLAPALLAGCTVVIKPAPQTPLHMTVLAGAVAAALPAGVVNIVTGGATAGDELVRHPLVGKVSFTGSTGVGRAIGTACAEQLKPATLELGGKSAAIVLPDTDIDVFTSRVIHTCMRNMGQTCHAATRLLFPRERYDELVDATVRELEALVVGDPRSDKTRVGPLVSAAQLERVQGYIKLGLEEGAVIATGGDRPAGQPAGYYLSPTLFRDVTPGMRIAQEEIFGPVLVAIPYDSEAQAVEIANDSSFGLGGVVYGADTRHAQEIAAQIQTGTVGINTFSLNLGAPFGGWKESGIGAELGPEGLHNFIRYQAVTVASEGR
jgi:acyl-CoA reductase-like NAD-dependent aldehyde dehydrogenase